MTQVSNNNNSQINDTTYTKVFVGGLAWETQKDTMKQYFEQFGNILEAVVISDKSTGRSKGYGFVTFCEAESAMKACVDPTPVIDGRRANCNLAAFAVQKSKPSSPNHNKQGAIEGRSMSNNHLKKCDGVRSVFACATSLPHYAAVHQGPMHYNVVGYSQDYAYPTNYYGMYGGATAGQYPIIYGTAGANVGMTMTSMKRSVSATAAPYYPCVQYPTRGTTFSHYPYHAHQQPQHLIHPAPYSAMSSTSVSYPAYQPYVYGGPAPILMALPPPILHR